jgi:toxin ParE1/3/4
VNFKVWQVILSAEAEKDFSRILMYTRDTFGPHQAEIYETTLLNAIALLDGGPDILGSIARDELRPGIRSLHVARGSRRGRHVIMYRTTANQTIDVVRILHDAMDLARHIPPESA